MLVHLTDQGTAGLPRSAGVAHDAGRVVRHTDRSATEGPTGPSNHCLPARRPSLGPPRGPRAGGQAPPHSRGAGRPMFWSASRTKGHPGCRLRRIRAHASSCGPGHGPPGDGRPARPLDALPARASAVPWSTARTRAARPGPSPSGAAGTGRAAGVDALPAGSGAGRRRPGHGPSRGAPSPPVIGRWRARSTRRSRRARAARTRTRRRLVPPRSRSRGPRLGREPPAELDTPRERRHERRRRQPHESDEPPVLAPLDAHSPWPSDAQRATIRSTSASLSVRSSGRLRNSATRGSALSAASGARSGSRHSRRASRSVVRRGIGGPSIGAATLSSGRRGPGAGTPPGRRRSPRRQPLPAARTRRG